MITNFGKILTILAFILCIGFVVTAGLGVSGTYPWEKHTTEMTDYSFKKSGEAENNIQYSVSKRRVPKGQNGDIKTSKLQPEVIVAARKDEVQRNNQAIKFLDQLIPQEKQYRDDLKADYDRDMKALQQHQQLLEKQQADLATELKNLSNAVLQDSEKISSARSEQIARRKDVSRLQAQYDQIETDRTQAEVQRTELIDRLYRLKGTVSSLKRRNKQLKSYLNGKTTE